MYDTPCISVSNKTFLPDPCTREESFDIVVATGMFVAANALLGALLVVILARLVHFLVRHAFFFTPGPPKRHILHMCHSLAVDIQCIPHSDLWNAFDSTLLSIHKTCKNKYMDVLIQDLHSSFCGIPMWEGWLGCRGFSSCCII